MSKKNDSISSTNLCGGESDEKAQKEKTSRRGFLTKSTQIIGGLLALPVVQSVSGQEQISKSDEPADVLDPERPLLLQVPNEVRNAEAMINALEQSAALRQQFVTQPSTVLRSFSIINSPEPFSISDTNRMFLSIVSNRSLMDWTAAQTPVAPPPPEIQAIFRRWAQAQGGLDLPSEYISGVVKEIARNQNFLNEFLRRLAQDSAVSALLPAGIGEQELTAVATAGLREMANDAYAGRLPVMSAANRKGIYVVSGNTQRVAIFVFCPGIAIAVIVVLVAIHLGCWVTGPTPANFAGGTTRLGILDLSRQLAELKAFDVPQA
jgi:hypothetical protein